MMKCAGKNKGWAGFIIDCLLVLKHEPFIYLFYADRVVQDPSGIVLHHPKYNNNVGGGRGLI